MRVACVRGDGFVINVIEVKSMREVPDIVYVGPDGKVVRKNEVRVIPTDVGSVDDYFIEGRGFYRHVGM